MKNKNSLFGAVIFLIILILLFWLISTGIGDAWNTLKVIADKQVSQLTAKEFFYLAILLIFIYKL